MKDRKSLLNQKASMRWLKDGDVNSSYFHKSIARRRKRNEMVGLQIGDEWVEEPRWVKEEVQRHFSDHFRSRQRVRLRLPVDFAVNKLSAEQGQDLISRFTVEEVKAAVWACDSDRSPGPDGFNFGFLKACWEVVKVDLCKVLEDFYSNGRIPKGCNPSFIVLIPKKEDAMELNHFRPVSLIGCLYKVIAKVLASRIRPVMDSIIGLCQSVFVKGRNILDGIVVLNEVIEEARRKKMRRVIFKVDFAKAYDSIDWEFLEEMMERLNFPARWRKWIMECISSATANVLVNGSPSGQFHLERGVRQGDPLSPFLFLIVAEGLNLLIGRVVERGLLRPVEVGRDRIRISHLQYADDTLFVVDGVEENAKVIKGPLNLFENLSGLSVNFEKCSVCGLNLEEMEVQGLVDLFGCRRGSIPVDYLGMKVGGGLNRLVNWEALVERMRKKVSSWKVKSLSFGGRVTHINSVLATIPTYRMAFSPIPAGIAKEFRMLQRKFL